MRKILILLCVLLASPAAAQIQKVQGVAGGYPLPVSVSGGSFPVPTGGATSALQTTGNASLASIDTKLSSQATAANQTTGNTSLSSIDATLTLLNAKFGSLGQKTAAGSAPVVLASDQTLPLPTGAATETTLGTRASSANQTNGSQKTQVVDAGGNVQPAGDSTARPIYVSSAPRGYTYAHMGTASTTTHKSGAGVLRRVCYNFTGASSGITIYDNTAGSGSVIASITVPMTGGPACMAFDAIFSTGATSVTTGAAQDFTVMYE
jgi:hypothetical protein